ncbi:sensor histidine kinase [Rothia nasimurium]|uniref:sensor histidine kinase n=1 Tax=Rothia nasimurium TaxID=85336 RepID=UPI002DD68E91|nr:sensor domain-containing protein [Rothia nasimurium]
MTSTDYTLHDAAPAAPAAGSQAPASFDTEPADQPKPVKSLWRRMANPFYIFTAGPWIAFAVLVAQGIVASLVTGLTASLIGLLVLPFVAIGFGVYERWRLAKTGHGVIANGHVDYPNAGFFEGAFFRLKEIATWREVGSLALTTVWGWLAGVVLFLQIMALGGAGAVAYYLGIGNRLYLDWQYLSFYSQGELDYYINQGLLPANGQIFEVTPQYWWVFLVAIPVLLITFAYVNGLMAATGASLSKLILSSRPEEQERELARLTASRATIVDAFEGERRRIERNLHDGVQQELVNLNLRLGLAEMEAKNLAADTQDARAAALLNHVTEARTQLSHAQQTLRDTVRGIYPAVLEDHGLKAALEELVRHSVLPVHLTYDAPARLPRDIERTAYYTVNEALTNTLKHAQAQFVSLSAFVAGDSLVVTAEDNGIGGADPARGTGLAGLVERAAALGGTVQVDSPAGGPTRLTLALPLPKGSTTL